MPIKRHSAELIVRKLRDGPACLDAAGPLYVLPRNYNLLRWLDRDLEPDQRQEVTAHVNRCPECEKRLKEMNVLGKLPPEMWDADGERVTLE